jgi:hypothetical protein
MRTAYKQYQVYIEKRILELEMAISGYQGILQRPHFAGDYALLRIVSKMHGELLDLKNLKMELENAN